MASRRLDGSAIPMGAGIYAIPALSRRPALACDCSNSGHRGLGNPFAFDREFELTEGTPVLVDRDFGFLFPGAVRFEPNREAAMLAVRDRPGTGLCRDAV